MSKHNTCTLLCHALVMCLQLGSSMGKLLCEKLSSKMPGVVKQATRALCNMWCCPEVVPEVGGQQHRSAHDAPCVSHDLAHC